MSVKPLASTQRAELSINICMYKSYYYIVIPARKLHDMLRCLVFNGHRGGNAVNVHTGNRGFHVADVLHGDATIYTQCVV